MNHDAPVMENSNPFVGIFYTLLTFVSGMTVMELTQGVLSIIAGIMTICLLGFQLRKAVRESNAVKGKK